MPPQSPPPPPPDPRGFRPNRSPHAGRKSNQTLWIVLSLLGAFFVLMVFTLSVADFTNAQCATCGHKWRIPQHEGISAIEHEYSCPNCGWASHAGALYYNHRQGSASASR